MRRASLTLPNMEFPGRQFTELSLRGILHFLPLGGGVPWTRPSSICEARKLWEFPSGWWGVSFWSLGLQQNYCSARTQDQPDSLLRTFHIHDKYHKIIPLAHVLHKEIKKFSELVKDTQLVSVRIWSQVSRASKPVFCITTFHGFLKSYPHHVWHVFCGKSL